MAVIKMGNRLHRTYYARYAAESIRENRKKELSASLREENKIRLLHKALYNNGSTEYLLSFSEYSSTNQPKTVKINLSLHKDSVKLYSDSNTGLYGVSFILNSMFELQVSVYYFAKEIIDTAKKAQYLSLTKDKSPAPISLKVNPGKNQEIITSAVLDLSKFTHDEQKFVDKKTFPLIIFLQSATESFLYYFKIESGNLIKVRESYSIKDESYEVLDIYG